jgi:hypothetical protein
VDSGVRGGKCGTTDFGEAGSILKSSCFIRNFCGKEDISVTVSSGVLSEISGFGGKSPFSLCSIKTFKVHKETADVLDECARALLFVWKLRKCRERKRNFSTL